MSAESPRSTQDVTHRHDTGTSGFHTLKIQPRGNKFVYKKQTLYKILLLGTGSAKQAARGAAGEHAGRWELSSSNDSRLTIDIRML